MRATSNGTEKDGKKASIRNIKIANITNTRKRNPQKGSNFNVIRFTAFFLKRNGKEESV